MTEKEKYCWDDFVEWCESQGVDLEFEEDYGAWWDCWKAAIDKAGLHRRAT
jgi:hypothetical protein